MLLASQALPLVVPHLNALLDGIHIMRVPAPATGAVGGLVELSAVIGTIVL
jgi:hypothetical protein